MLKLLRGRRPLAEVGRSRCAFCPADLPAVFQDDDRLRARWHPRLMDHTAVHVEVAALLNREELCGAAKRRLRNYLLGIGASLGFGTFASYVYLRASKGPVTAALIVCAAYGLLPITSLAILAIGVARRRAGLFRRAAAASAPPSPGNFDSLL